MNGNTFSRGKGHQHLLHVALSDFKLPFDCRTRRLAQSGGTTRPLNSRGRSAALLPVSVMMWRLIAYDTEPGRAHGLLTAWAGWADLALLVANY
jgi:hypothetical protein